MSFRFGRLDQAACQVADEPAYRVTFAVGGPRRVLIAAGRMSEQSGWIGHTELLLNTANGELIVSLHAGTGPGGSVNAVASSPDGSLLATASGNGTVQFRHTGLPPMP
jgi:hypothetical protein